MPLSDSIALTYFIQAFNAYQGREVDWAGALGTLRSPNIVAFAAKAAGASCSASAPSSLLSTSAASSPLVILRPPPLESLEFPSSSELASNAARLPSVACKSGEAHPRGVTVCARGLVSVDPAETVAGDALKWLLAALYRNGCVILKHGVPAGICDDAIAELAPYS